MTGRTLLLIAGGVVVAVLLCAGAAGALFGAADPALACNPMAASSTSASTGPIATASVVPAGGRTPTARPSVTPAADGSYPRIGAWNPTQVANAATIIAVGKRLNIPARGWIVALATAMQESRLINIDHGDRDSLGLFQQRPSQGWGTPTQVRDPIYAATAFYRKLLTIGDWQNLPVTQAAQAVQRSALPNAYARWETDATTLVTTLAGAATSVGDCEVAAGPQGWVAPVRAPIVSGFRTGRRPGHDGVDLGAQRGTRIVAAAAGTVSRVRCNVGAGHSCDEDGFPGLGGCGWYVDLAHPGGVISRYCHMLRRPLVVVGQHVAAGQQLGVVGSSGNSSGPHLHFEIHLRNDASGSGAVEPVAWMRDHGAPLG